MKKKNPPIPFNRPCLAGDELVFINEALQRGHLAGDGRYGQACETLLEKWFGGGSRVLLATSCTHALEMAALLYDIGPGDEVILPTFTFVSTANAFVLRGATPVFCDIHEDTLNLDERLLPGLLTPRTRALALVHYGGVGCAMESVARALEGHPAELLEDNAHGLFATHAGRALGSFGSLATLSFHETKNFHCGEGGALVVNRPDLVERAEILRSKGTNRKQFFRGQTDKYTWVDIGSSYTMSELQAAFLYAQLKRRRVLHASRRNAWNRYARELRDWAARHGVRLPVLPATAKDAVHVFYLILPDAPARARFLAHMKAADILSVFHYVPLHSSPMGRRLGPDACCPVAEDLAARLVRLPLFNHMPGWEQDRVVERVLEFEP